MINSTLLLQPTYRGEKFKYVSTLGNSFDYWTFNNVHRDLYVFCKIGYENYFQNMLSEKLACKSGTVYGKVTVYKLNKSVRVTTTAPFIKFFDCYCRDDFVHSTSMYILRTDTDTSYNSLCHHMNTLRSTFKYMHVLAPETLEQRFLFAKLFELKTQEDPIIVDKLQIVVFSSVYDLGSVNPSQLYTPTGYYSLHGSGDFVEKFNLYKQSKIVSILKMYPIVGMRVVRSLNMKRFDPKDNVLVITLTCFRAQKFQHYHLCLRDQKVTYDINKPASSRSVTDFFETERELLKGFLELYVSGKGFHCVPRHLTESHFQAHSSNICSWKPRLFTIFAGPKFKLH